MADRLRVNQLALQVPAWVALAVARLTEVPGHLGVPPSFAECVAMLAFGDELLVLPDDDYKWRSPGGRELAAAYLLPLAEAALRPRCSGWPTRLVAVPGQRLTDGSRAKEPRASCERPRPALFLSIYLPQLPDCDVHSLSDAYISARPAKLVLDLKNIDMIALEILLGSKACSKSQAWKS